MEAYFNGADIIQMMGNVGWKVDENGPAKIFLAIINYDGGNVNNTVLLTIVYFVIANALLFLNDSLVKKD